LLRRAEEEGLLTQVSRAMLRAMAKAKYSDIKQLHFGLGIESYCHFTSPIRRLSDLATHRIIHKVIFDGGEAKKYSSYAKRAAAAATEGELRALSCERKIEGLYKTVYFLGRIGEEFFATVSSVTSYGMFCELDNTCEGLVSIHSIGGYFDEKNRMVRTPGGTFAIGDRVRIRVENADIIHTRVDFSLVLED
jgi:ribonuclease R